MSKRLQNKVTLVTGSGSGIGRGCALMFARNGATVIGCDLDTAGSEETLALAGEEGLSLESFHPCDLTDPEQVELMVSQVIERHGRIDRLVNCAAYAAFAPIEDIAWCAVYLASDESTYVTAADIQVDGGVTKW